MCGACAVDSVSFTEAAAAVLEREIGGVGWARRLRLSAPVCGQCRDARLVDLSLYFGVMASGQISAKSNRGRVISPTFAACFSRQRSLNRPFVFSTVMASQNAPHWLSSLANTR